MPNSTENHILVGCYDLNGQMRGKRVPASAKKKALNGELRMPKSAAGIDIWGRDTQDDDIIFATGDADALCHPTVTKPFDLSWLSEPTLLIPCALYDDESTPFAGDPRNALQTAVKRLTEMNLRAVMAMELEFYLWEASYGFPPNHIDTEDRLLCIDNLTEKSAFLNDLYKACKPLDINADSAISESGRGQYEINLLHRDDPLLVADEALLFKRVIKGVASKHGMLASFMAKPDGAQPGNGMHVHCSLVDEKNSNIYDDGGELGTEALQHSLAGVLKHLRAQTILFAPHANSYRRLQPHSHAPTAIAWGYDNRTAALRIPSGPAEARRFEHRVAGADANPYLVLAAIIHAVADGLEEKLNPPPTAEGDIYSQDHPQIAPDWQTAWDLWAHNEWAKNRFGDTLHTMYTATKRQEIARFNQTVSPLELQSYLTTV